MSAVITIEEWRRFATHHMHRNSVQQRRRDEGRARRSVTARPRLAAIVVARSWLSAAANAQRDLQDSTGRALPKGMALAVVKGVNAGLSLMELSLVIITVVA